MASIHRKSILSIKNLELSSTYEKFHNLNPLNSNTLSTQSIVSNSQSSKLLPRGSLQIKIKRLNDMKLTSLFEKDSASLSGFNNIPKSNICISEL